MNRLKSVDPIDIHNIIFNAEERAYLRRLARSSRLRDRKLCLRYFNNCWRPPKNHQFVLSVAESLIQDYRVRHEALGCIADYVADHPAKVWPVIRKYSSSRSIHIRASVAAAALEVLLSQHHAMYFPKVKHIVLSGDKRFLDTLTMCWPFGQKQEHWRRLVLLIKDAGGDMDRVYRSEKYPLPTKG